MDHSLLYPGRQDVLGDESPGSSVFDLPVQPTNPITSSELPPPMTVISGGSGGNSICSAFDNACFVLPVSDDGGSSSEIIRVLGGPSIGDIRSRLVRLIPLAPPTSPLGAVRTLLSYRLPANVSEREARAEWRDIIEGQSALWTGIPNDRKETIRGFLVYFENEVLKRAHKNFSFLNGSIGNYFISGAQIFFRSLPSAIFLFASITNSQANILPVIVTNHTVTIAAELENGSRLVGQCEISHPVNPSSSFEEDREDPLELDLFSPVDGMGETIPHRSNVMYSQTDKDRGYESLKARICRLYYINAYGHEVHPTPNPEFVKTLSTSEALVYSCGSLWTSIIPCLALRGVASAIARSSLLRAKILLLNGKNDRETDGYTAVDYVRAIAAVLNSQYQTPSYGLGNASTIYPISAFITHLVYLEGTSVHVDVKALTALGVRCIMVRGKSEDATERSPQYDAGAIRHALAQILA
ncbi:hypothetical protein HYDPIDRAFT_99914 [Hydnomerulius pinastri MD-312]|uniref:Unplaced genomic scaffold scaffold_46, whole genome shotgun sequence n=1 Tax=Hydnomerulius pinastri MD-312 TaxID=994086 RepID=A0A0C9W9X4_9AGAM|nr:hypothetical protein HYDPIDRAFT_99914 [Hydnomerulius pinastri MD-312]